MQGIGAPPYVLGSTRRYPAERMCQAYERVTMQG
jgi:hypothetical protein